MDPIEARFLAPPLVKKGQALRMIEERLRQKDLIKAKKEKLNQKYGDQARRT